MFCGCVHENGLVHDSKKIHVWVRAGTQKLRRMYEHHRRGRFCRQKSTRALMIQHDTGMRCEEKVECMQARETEIGSHPALAMQQSSVSQAVGRREPCSKEFGPRLKNWVGVETVRQPKNPG